MDTKKDIDTCGYCCPVPLLKLVKTLKTVDKGDLVGIKVTDKDFDRDVSRAEEVGKLKVVSKTEGDDYDYFIIEKV